MDLKLTLARIARALDVPVEAFGDPETGRRAEEAAELLRLFEAIVNPADRRKVLRFRESLADRQRLEASAAAT